MVRVRAEALKAEGYAVYVEAQNKITLKGQAATLGGVPDLVAVRGGEGFVIGCKSGKHRDSDFFQVHTYMRVLPITHAACRGVPPAGEVQYGDTPLRIAPGQLTDELKGLIRGTIERVGSAALAVKVPSLSECRCPRSRPRTALRVDEEQSRAAVDHDLF